MEPHCLEHPCRVTWAPAPLSAYLFSFSGCQCTTSQTNRDTRLYPPHNNSSIHLTTTTTYVRRPGRITSGKRSGWTTLRDSALSSPTPASTLPEWPFQAKRGSGLTASTPVSDISAPACTNAVWPLCGLWVWRRRANRRPCCPPMPKPPTSSWTARPDGSGWWDIRMTAQHLPRDLVRPSSGLKSWLKRRRRRLISALFQLTFSNHCWTFVKKAMWDCRPITTWLLEIEI